LPYRLQLLGRFALVDPSGEAVALTSKKGQAMIACLALAGDRGVTREELQSLLWSDRDEAQASSSLRQALSALRRSLGNGEASPLKVTGAEVTLDPAAIAVDAAAFEVLSASKDLSDLEAATNLVQGELLEGLDVRDQAFEDWLLLERQRLSSLEAVLLEKLLKRYELERKTDKALEMAERVLRRDPLRESVYRSLMRLHAAAGDRSAALKMFERCRKALKDELGLEPEEATKALLEDITHGELAGHKRVKQDAPADESAGRDYHGPIAHSQSLRCWSWLHLWLSLSDR
jgi:DNA-binding SARP family transcriptional activator